MGNESHIRVHETDVVGYLKVVFREEVVYQQPIINYRNECLESIEKRSWSKILSRYGIKTLCMKNVYIVKEYCSKSPDYLLKQKKEIFKEGENQITPDFKPIPKIRS